MPPQALIPDILRVAFEIAARQDSSGRTALKLALVSRLVRSWIDIVLYEVVRLYRYRTSINFLWTIENSAGKPLAFFSTHVKSLCILFDMPAEHLAKIISVCQGIQNLTTWFLPDPHAQIYFLPDSMLALRPRKLSAWHGVLHSPDPQFWLPFFNNITHLTVVNTWQDWTTWPGFGLPSLTHLSLDVAFGARVLGGGDILSIARAVDAILTNCAYIQVCALRVDQPAESPTVATMLDCLADARVVFFRAGEPFRIREAHSHEEAVIWEVLEEAVERQRGGHGMMA
ncbi:hypothetical protein B0H10DRAFT_1985480 [Mycena sp. CBHHK59/15]|nr:hypothetical protein B0H10DRAFT_1985480 [Mycena sp. CBHHK59/15]